MSDGIGCVCAARSEYECCCDADWRPQELIDLQQQLASRDAEVAELVAALDAMHNDSEECLDFDEFTAMLVPMDIWHGVFDVLDKVRKQ